MNLENSTQDERAIMMLHNLARNIELGLVSVQNVYLAAPKVGSDVCMIMDLSGTPKSDEELDVPH